MNIHLDPAHLRVAETYDAAADCFDAPAPSFWDRHGRAAANLAELAEGQDVLDIGCGTGASALPVARLVAPAGRVCGVDIASEMLRVARSNARAEGNGNISPLRRRCLVLRRVLEPPCNRPGGNGMRLRDLGQFASDRTFAAAHAPGTVHPYTPATDWT